MSILDTSERFYPAGQQEWHAWLQAHHDKKPAVWLICYKRGTEKYNLSWAEAVEEALCFGWIDSVRRPVDEEKFIQFYCPRKSTSMWSKINKEKVERLIAEGRMTAVGMKCIEVAKENGCWSMLDEVEALVVPADLARAFRSEPGSEEFFEGLSKSVKKQLLHWVMSARREETRHQRISEIARCAGLKALPKPFQKR